MYCAASVGVDETASATKSNNVVSSLCPIALNTGCLKLKTVSIKSGIQKPNKSLYSPPPLVIILFLI